MNSGPLSPLGFCSHNACLVPPPLCCWPSSPRILLSLSQKAPLFDSVKPAKFPLLAFPLLTILPISWPANLSFHTSWHLLPNYTDTSSGVAILVPHLLVLLPAARRWGPCFPPSLTLSLTLICLIVGVLLLPPETAVSPSVYQLSPVILPVRPLEGPPCICLPHPSYLGSLTQLSHRLFQLRSCLCYSVSSQLSLWHSHLRGLPSPPRSTHSNFLFSNI